MIHKLSNTLIELDIADPSFGYSGSRFDRTGKLIEVRYKGMPITGSEDTDKQSLDKLGRGFYNEFGMDNALGFEDTPEGGWFHKIGVGLLKKTGIAYDFREDYAVRPATFRTATDKDSIIIDCHSACLHGYAYHLRKTYRVFDDGFLIDYKLENKGELDIITEEYTHNFLRIGDRDLSKDIHLELPFALREHHFGENLNPNRIVRFEDGHIHFNRNPDDIFFFSYLNGKERASATWFLTQDALRFRLSEKGDFESVKVNLWGNRHVISPELFHSVHVKPGDVSTWQRRYRIHQI